MTKEKKKLYEKAFVELYELIQLLSIEEQQKIPEYFIKYIKENMDKDYVFYIDNSKNILNQEYMIETKALIVKIYEEYLAPEEEKEFWNKYDKICLQMIENEKRKKFSTDNIFNNNEKLNSSNTLELRLDNNKLDNNKLDNNNLDIDKLNNKDILNNNNNLESKKDLNDKLSLYNKNISDCEKNINNERNLNNLPIEIKKENLLKRLITYIKKIFSDRK